MGFFRNLWCYRKLMIILLTPLLLLPLPLIIKTKVSKCAYTMLVVAIYWLTEAMPLSIAALLPAFMFPLFGIMQTTEVASTYFKDFHLLLIGVCLATSIEKSNLHKRIALKMVILMGVNPGQLMMGFMLSCVFLSMWFSNTSTAAMVMPIVEAVLQHIMNAETDQALELNEKESEMKKLEAKEKIELELNKQEIIKAKENETMKQESKELDGYYIGGDIHAYKIEPDEAAKKEAVSKYSKKKDQNVCKGMCLGITYASTIGGLTTITGTSTNLILAEQINTRYPDCHCINFGSWFVLVFPMTVIILLLSWVWLHVIYFGFKYQEIVTLTIFCFMALLWFTWDPGFFPGWSFLFPQCKDFATDSTVALLLGLLFFILPADKPTSAIKKELKQQEYTTLITWAEFQSCMPWEILLLVASGFALAKGSEISGLSLWVGSKLEPIGTLPVWVIVVVSCLIVTSVTEIASNPATITIFLPILAPWAEAIHVNSLYLLVPSTLCASFAFLLPASNPPNAIVYGYGHLTVMDVVKAGLGVNIIGILVVMIAMTTWAIPLYDLKTYPSWAQDLGNATIP
uniref:solute carrier family 13 member 1 n=1 Tax=Pristiophorus japonicus TaxID=55135 RepID=UPI00398ECA1E